MAINYLNSINLNRNELQNAYLINPQIENQPNDAAAGTGYEGQLYFDTTLDALKIWAGGAWVEVGATSGVETFTTTKIGNSVGNPLTVLTDVIGPVTVNSFAYAGGSNVGYVPAGGTVGKYLDGAGNWLDVTTGDITAVLPGTYINIDNSTGPEPTVNHDLTTRTDTASTAAPGYGVSFTAVDSVTTNSTGHVTALNLKTVTLPASDNTDNYVDSLGFDTASGVLTLGRTGALPDLTKNLDGRYGLIDNQTVTLTGDVTGSGTTSITTIISAGAVDFAMVNPAAVITESEGIGNNDNDTTWPTTAAVKDYVDSSVAGQLVYQGGYNAATNTPNLDATPTITIKIGFTWTVTADGLFYSEQVRVGDLLISEVDAPTSLADWTTVQNNIDLASAATIGIGNVVPGTSNTITAPYTNGTATLDVVNSTASQKGAVIVAAGTGISVGYSGGTATVTNTNTNASNTATGTIAIGALSGTVTHAFGINTIVQTIDSSGNTVFCDISRTATTCVATISVVQATAITILVQKIG